MGSRLIVSDFSCICSADISVDELTVIIGPSASGKSIISKLVFFFNDLINEQWHTIEDGKGFDSFKDLVKEKFKEWFPVEAWGDKKFQIEFHNGDYQVRISRVEYRKKLGDNMRVWFSPFFEEQYDYALTQMRNVIKTSLSGPVDHRAMMARYEVQDSLRKIFQSKLGKGYVGSQIFIPAGRSFFTSIGKSIAAFENNRMLDPLIIRFGRYFAAIRERGFRYPSPKVAGPLSDRLDELMSGSMVFERNKEYLKTSDGRKVPFSAMSSGQQELMPLVLALKMRAAYPGGDSRNFLYIEEPEAHLFPSAQSSLVEALSLIVSGSQGGTSMVLTTHSPYVISKLNNLVTARRIAGKRRGTKKHAAVSAIVSEEYWLDGSGLNVYAIIDGSAVRIQDEEDGMINASYLDDVSGDISNEFLRILAVEYK